jgi:kumamolisin
MALAVGVVLAPLTALSGPAAAATPSADAPEQVQAGIHVASLHGATASGATPPGTTETVSFVLRERNIDALSASAQAGIKHFLSVGQFAGIYGQTQDNISALTSYLAGYGITATVYPDDVDVVATGTAGEFGSALSVTQEQYRVPAQRGPGQVGLIPAQDNVRGNVNAPVLPYRLSSFVLAILGLSNYAPFTDDTVKPPTDLSRPQPGHSNSCLATFGLAGGCHLPSGFAATYGLDPLYREGATGTGQTIGIVTLAAVDPGAPQYFWSRVAHVTRGAGLTVRDIDGGPGAPSAGSAETDLDIEQSGALAPNANVIAYQAPDSDGGFADAFFSAASQNAASTVSAGWGQSEAYLRAPVLPGQQAAAFAGTFDEAFLEMAAQGQSTFVASGDAGASGQPGTTGLSVDSPADSPFVTAAGGATLPWTGTLTGMVAGTPVSAPVSVTAQRIWGWDYLWPALAATSGIALAATASSYADGSGGGFSQFEPVPHYQQDVPGTQTFHAVPYLTPTFDPSPTVTSGPATGRALPDISADADPETGYLLYAPSLAGPGQSGLSDAGGTGFVASQLNGAAAVIDSYLGRRVGLWNPDSYATAVSSHSPFIPLNATGAGNDNTYYTGNPGDRYNQGAGLGVPDLAKLAGDFPR